jgi:hypothetical protein
MTIETAREIFHWEPKDEIGTGQPSLDDFNESKIFIAGYEAGVRAALKKAESEEVPKAEDLPVGAIDIFLVSPTYSMIAAIRATKKSIVEKITSLLGEKNAAS